MELTIEVYQNDDANYSARCVELELFSFGKTENEAYERINHIIAFYISSLDELGIELETDDWDFIEANYYSTPNRYSIFQQNHNLQ